VGMTTEAWPDATGTAPRGVPSTAKVTVPAAEAPPEALTEAVAVVPDGSGVTDRATVAVAATGAAEPAAEVDDDGADDGLGVEVWTAAAGSGVPTDDNEPEPLTAGPHAASRTHSPPAATTLALVLHREPDIGCPHRQVCCRALPGQARYRAYPELSIWTSGPPGGCTGWLADVPLGVHATC
jgi:hypothetical protein